MVYTKQNKLNFASWQKILTDFPDEPIILSAVFKQNCFASWVTVRGYLELMHEKGLITIKEKGHTKVCELTDTGKAFRKQLQWMMQVIPIAGENDDTEKTE